MADVPVVEIGDDEWLSQCGQRRADGSWNFRNRPRLGKEPPEQDVSWLLGRH